MSDSQISERERDILRLVATGATNQQIAQQLNISANTVKVHLRNIFSKIGAASRTEATLYAVRTGLVHVGQTPELPALGETLAAPQSDPAATSVATSSGAPTLVGTPPDVAAPFVEPSLPITNGDSGPATSHTGPPPRALDRNGPVIASERSSSRRWLLAGGALLALLVLAGLTFVLTRPTNTTTQPTAVIPTGVGLPSAPLERWHELPPMPAGRTSFALASYNDDGKVYLYAIGGELGGHVSGDVVRYDLAGRIWTAWGSKPTPVSDVQAAMVGNKIYVPGGRLATGQATDIFEAYDPQNNSWATLKPLPKPRSGYALAAFEGKLYLFGGWDGTAQRAEVWQYNPDQNEWAERSPMPTARAFAGAAVLDGQIFVAGGESQGGPLTVNERYSPSDDGTSNPWSTQQPLPAPRSHMAMTATNGRIFVVGGRGSNGDLFIYNNSWQTQTIPLGDLRDLRAQALADKLYIFGGQADAASAKAYEYQALYTVLVPVSGPTD
jgi:DNA-binding CsgD family transcriptional regulator